MTNDEIIEAIRQGGRELQQRIWDEFFSVSLISDTKPDTSPIPTDEVDKMFTEMNAFGMPCIKPYPIFEPSLTEEQFAALEEATEGFDLRTTLSDSENMVQKETE